MYFTISIKNNNTGRISDVNVVKKTSRGTILESKKFKTIKAAKTWITRRENELVGTINESTWSFEVVEHSC